MNQLLFCFLFLSGTAFSQSDRDSMAIARKKLNAELLDKIHELKNGPNDFLLFRVNDSLSDDYNSYECHYNTDSSCTDAYKIFINPKIDFGNSHYNLLHGSIGFFRIPRSKNEPEPCYDRIAYQAKIPEMDSVFKLQDVSVTEEDLMINDYFLYGRIGGKFIVEKFDRQFLIAEDPGIRYRFITSYVQAF
jgi:hypothetical protein